MNSSTTASPALRKSTRNGSKAHPPKPTPEYELGSGNVFADLGIPYPEEALAKAKIARVICNLVESKAITQADLAKRLRLDQPAVSRLLRGLLTEFSVGRLLMLLMRLGQVDLTVIAN